MARYEHLPIYKKALDVAVHFEKVVAGFSRYHKYTLGTELRNQSRARYGFPVSGLRVYLARLLALGRPVMVVGEEDEYFTAVKTRAPVCRYEASTSGGATPGARTQRSGAAQPAAVI